MTPWEQSSRYNESLRYLEGSGVKEDDARAFALNLEAAREGHADAMLAMGWFYWNGVGVERDDEAARAWYRKSARRGEPKAMFSLGWMEYLVRDYSGARIWWQRAADAGHFRSLYWLGKLHWRGHGVERNRKQAMRLFHQAASRKDREARRVLRFLSRKRASA